MLSREGEAAGGRAARELLERYHMPLEDAWQRRYGGKHVCKRESIEAGWGVRLRRERNPFPKLHTPSTYSYGSDRSESRLIWEPLRRSST
jgi:hypothetical protein